MSLYLDLIYGLNTVVTASLLYMTAQWLGHPALKRKLLLAALLSGAPLFLWLTDYGHWLIHPFSQFIICLGTILFAFGFQTFSRFVKTVILFYFISWLSGGAVLALTIFWQNSALLQTWGESSRWVLFDDMHGLLVLSTLPIVLAVTGISKQALKTEKKTSGQLAQLSIQMVKGGTVVETTALIDTGNQLKDPISRAPVLLLEADLFRAHMRAEEWQETVQWLKSEGREGKMKWGERMKVIPYRTVGREHGFLFAVNAHEVTVEQQERSKTSRNVLIGFEHRQLSTEQRYCAIAPPELLPHSEDTNASVS